jgi:tetratricopeptide (TPR) repeat protein
MEKASECGVVNAPVDPVPIPYLVALRRQALFLAVALMLAVPLGWAGWRGFVHWRQGFLVGKAEQARQQSDWRGASLYARRALQLNPRNVEAARLMAEMSEKFSLYDALHWRAYIAALLPEDADAWKKWARLAGQTGDDGQIRQALERLPAGAGAGTNASVQQAGGALAMQLRDYRRAEPFFRKALELEPDQVSHRLNLSSLHLVWPLTGREEARRELEAMVGDPAMGRVALRALLSDALRRGQPKEALRWARELSKTEAAFSDRLLILEALKTAKEPDFEGELEKVRVVVQDDRLQTAALMEWVNGAGMPARVLKWAAGLPAPVRQEPPVAFGVAEAARRAGDRDILQELQGWKWGDADYLRLAYVAVLFRDREPARFRAVWQQALAATQRQPGALSMLATRVAQWGWEEEAEETWWKMVDLTPYKEPALRSLYTLYRRQKNTPGLFRVSKRQHQLHPEDLVAANNFAALGLLLGQSVPEARRAAARLYKDHPEIAAFASTQAFALHSEGKTAEGLQILKKLPPDQQRHPEIALYYALMLAKAGDAAGAREYAGRVDVRQLLPEESRLFAGLPGKESP